MYIFSCVTYTIVEDTNRDMKSLVSNNQRFHTACVWK